MATTNVETPTASTTLPADADQEGTEGTAADTRGERNSSRHLPLFREPLGNHSAHEKVAAIRAAIAAGADVPCRERGLGRGQGDMETHSCLV